LRTASRFVCVLYGLILLGANARLRTLDMLIPANPPSAGPTRSMSVLANALQGGVIVADQQPGSDMGTKINAANTRLGSAKGEIDVASSGDISTVVVLSENHDLVCASNQVTLRMTTPEASITQNSNTRVSTCKLSSSETSAVNAEISSMGTSNVRIEDVTFVGGGYHIQYNTVSNFSIKNTHHISITAKAASPILVYSSTHGQIISPRIDSFTVPDGNWSIRLVDIVKSSFIDVTDPVIRGVDASTVSGCGGVSFVGSTNSTLQGGRISGLKNCDGVLTEASGMTSASDIDISGTSSTGHNVSPGAGKNANNGEGFDVFNSKRVHLSNVISRDNGVSSSNRQPGIEVSNSTEVNLSNCNSYDSGSEGVRVDGSRGVTITGSRTNHNGGVGIMVMPAIGRVRAIRGSPIVTWTAGSANMTFSPVWPANTKIVIGDNVYSIASVVSTGRLILATDFSAATGEYGYNVDSYVEIDGGESMDNGQLSIGLPPDRNAGQREGVYFAGGFSGEITGGVTRLRATDTQDRKTQTFGIRVENRARIVARDNAVSGNLAGQILDSPGRSSIH
jgi:hypothetical protein